MLGEVPNPLVTPHKKDTGLYPSVARNSCNSCTSHDGHHDPDEIDDLVKVQVSIEIENYKEEMKKEMKEEVKEEIKKEEEEEKKKRKKEFKDCDYCMKQCFAFLMLLCFIGWGIMYYYSLFYYSDYEKMPAGVIAAISICGFFGAVSCACCVRYKVKQSAWRKKLRHERRAKENETSSIDSSL